MECRTVAVFPAHILAVDGYFLHVPLIQFTHELGGVDFRFLLPTAPLLNHGVQQRADSAITTQNTTVFTVEFTKKLLKKPGTDSPSKPRGSHL